MTVWSGKIFQDRKWHKGVAMVKMLCSICNVVTWRRGREGRDVYVHVPFSYESNGIYLEFLPHWDCYQVGAYCFDVRQTKEEILTDIAAVESGIAGAIQVRRGRISHRRCNIGHG